MSLCIFCLLFLCIKYFSNLGTSKSPQESCPFARTITAFACTDSAPIFNLLTNFNTTFGADLRVVILFDFDSPYHTPLVRAVLVEWRDDATLLPDSAP